MDTTDPADPAAAGAAALAQGHWTAAREAFERAPDGPEKWDGLAHALHHLGRYDAAIGARERAYAGFRARGETRRPAVIAARWLAFEYAAVRGDEAVANGWLERAERLVADEGDCVERGWVALARAIVAPDLAEARRCTAEAAALARACADTDLAFAALARDGACLVLLGRVREGMSRLDEAVAAAEGGEIVDPSVSGEIFCKMLLACESALDVRRAAQWTAVAEAFERRNGTRWISAICRMHHGGLLVAAGRWPEAEEELLASARDYHASFEALCAGAMARLADLRVSQGRWEEAEAILREHGGDQAAVRPSARLALARHRCDLAVTTLRRHLEDHAAEVSSAPLLALLVRARLAADDPGGAAEAAARLDRLATDAAVPSVEAFAHLARALVVPAPAGGGSPGVAQQVRDLEAACAAFGRAGLVVDGALARLELAERLHDTPEVATVEAREAFRVLHGLGARPGADAAAALLRRLGVATGPGPRGDAALSRREQEVLDLVAAGLSNPEIADRLVISRKTAGHHVSAVLAKLGVRNRAEAAAWAAQRRRDR